MMDAVTLANWINVLTTSSTHEEIDTAFREYQNERHPMAVKAFADSQMMSKLVAMVILEYFFCCHLHSLQKYVHVFVYPFFSACNNQINRTLQARWSVS